MNKVKKYNHRHLERQKMEIGSIWKCNKQIVDSENYLVKKI